MKDAKDGIFATSTSNTHDEHVSYFLDIGFLILRLHSVSSLLGDVVLILIGRLGFCCFSLGDTYTKSLQAFCPKILLVKALT